MYMYLGLSVAVYILVGASWSLKILVADTVGEFGVRVGFFRRAKRPPGTTHAPRWPLGRCHRLSQKLPDAVLLVDAGLDEEAQGLW